MESVKPKRQEYGIAVLWCKILGTVCRVNGKCHECETGLTWKGYELYLEEVHGK